MEKLAQLGDAMTTEDQPMRVFRTWDKQSGPPGCFDEVI